MRTEGRRLDEFLVPWQGRSSYIRHPFEFAAPWVVFEVHAALDTTGRTNLNVEIGCQPTPTGLLGWRGHSRRRRAILDGITTPW